MKIFNFLYICGYFLPSWIRIRILNADPDPATQINADPDPQPWEQSMLWYTEENETVKHGGGMTQGQAEVEGDEVLSACVKQLKGLL